MKIPHRYRIYDVLHKTTVSFLIGSTALAMVFLVGQGYFYFRDVRPQRIEASKKYLEEQLEQEQLAKEEELLMKQRQAESVKA